MSQKEAEPMADPQGEESPTSRRTFLARAGQAAVVPPTVGLVLSAGSKPAAAAKRYKNAGRAARRPEIREQPESRPSEDVPAAKPQAKAKREINLDPEAYGGGDK